MGNLVLCVVSNMIFLQRIFRKILGLPQTHIRRYEVEDRTMKLAKRRDLKFNKTYYTEYLLRGLGCLFFLVFGCNNVWCQSVNSEDDRAIATISADGAVELLVSKEDLKTISTTMIRSISKPKNFEIRFFDPERKVYNLVGEAFRDGQPVTFAIELDVEEGVLWYHRVNYPWYVCKKTGCNDCAFTTGIDGAVRRCACPDDEADIGACKIISGIKSHE